MDNQSTVGTLQKMKFSAMATELEMQLKDSEKYKKYGFEERIGMLVDAEWSRRQSNKLERHIKNVRFAIPSAHMEGIEYHEDRRLDKGQLDRFAGGDYIEKGHHIILKGASGNGKTYICNALGNAACRAFKTVRYIRMPELLDDLSVAKGCGNLKKVIKAYRKVDLLIIDEWLIRTLDLHEAYDLLEIIESRCDNGSIIFCTQYEPQGWYERINPDVNSDSPISDAIMDRVIHNSYEVLIDGTTSMRERKGLNSQDKDGENND